MQQNKKKQKNSTRNKQKTIIKLSRVCNREKGYIQSIMVITINPLRLRQLFLPKKLKIPHTNQNLKS